MKLWRIWQDVNSGYDTYDSAVVAADSADGAKMIHPSLGANWDGTVGLYDGWINAPQVQVELIGEAIEGTTEGVICASFNAG